ncbi:diguanylate cyclase domain-containing protein [Roseateles albus]|uniref:diguanylate cyclase n=1 Tax=Roseateles albus TaxID=2987525 RepID=A0ABT5K878_9BURK|nr:diguanylate cyclase [Roseateles albus]MDC8770063.1 diguanylate cyclase [Roseateles albus]
MGIRFKLLLTFVLGFGLMALVSLNLLQGSLEASYQSIEKRELASHVSRLVQSIESELEHLNSLTRDWAVWSEMYRFVQQPDPAWAQDSLGPQALVTADLSLIMVYDRQGRLVHFNTNPRLNRPAGETPVWLEQQIKPYIALIKDGHAAPTCGLMKAEIGLMLGCWAHIRRSDASGEFSGSVVMGRLLDADLLAKLSKQTRLPFQLEAPAEAKPDMLVWPDFVAASLLGSGEVRSSESPGLYHLALPVQDLLKRDVAQLALSVPRDVHAQGLLVYQQVRRQLLWTALVMACLMAVAVHLLLVRRLRRFTRQLVTLAKTQTWKTRIKVSGADELSTLSGHVNHLLSLIETQVDSLQQLSLTDALTGLTNRRGFDERLALELSNKCRGERKLALLMLDVDHFKLYNDHYGHPAGDAALKLVAQVLQAALRRGGDMAARIGGEEFALLLPETDAEGAQEVVKRLRQHLQQLALPHAASPVAPILSLSVGIALAADESPAALMARADQALYQAKQDGRDRAVLAE